MAQAKARAFIQSESMKAYNALVNDWEDLQHENQKAMDDSFWGGMIGSIGLPLLATLGGPISMAAAAGAAGLGSYMGQKAGETALGSRPGFQGGEAIESQGLQSGMQKELRTSANTLDDQFDSQVLMNAVQSAGSAYLMAGGAMPGTEAFKDAGGIGGLFDKTSNPAFGGKTIYDMFGNGLIEEEVFNEMPLVPESKPY